MRHLVYTLTVWYDSSSTKPGAAEAVANYELTHMRRAAANMNALIISKIPGVERVDMHKVRQEFVTSWKAGVALK